MFALITVRTPSLAGVYPALIVLDDCSVEFARDDPIVFVCESNRLVVIKELRVPTQVKYAVAFCHCFPSWWPNSQDPFAPAADMLGREVCGRHTHMQTQAHELLFAESPSFLQLDLVARRARTLQIV